MTEKPTEPMTTGRVTFYPDAFWGTEQDRMRCAAIVAFDQINTALSALERRIASLEERAKPMDAHPARQEPAEPTPQEPDYTCRACGEDARVSPCGEAPQDTKPHLWEEVAAAANARIRTLEQERGETQKDAESWHSGWQVAVKQRDEARRERDEWMERWRTVSYDIDRRLAEARREGREEARGELARMFDLRPKATWNDWQVRNAIRAHVFAAEKGGPK